MNPKSVKNKQYELTQTTESFAWLIKDKLTSIDNITRQMMTELTIVGVPKAMVEEYLPQFFIELKDQVVKEQAARYDKVGKVG